MNDDYVFCGPESIDRLRSSLQDGWKVEEDNFKDEVKFLFPIQKHASQLQTETRIANRLIELAEKHETIYMIGGENRPSEIEGKNVYHFCLVAEWPIHNELILALDGVKQQIVDSWISDNG